MHRKKQSRARQARRRETQQMALAKEKTARLALDIRQLCRTVEELTEEMKSLKRMIHAETVLRANVKPDSEPRPHHQSIPREPSPAQD